MITKKEQVQILSKPRPFEEDQIVYGEANLGGWYTEKEIDAVVSSIRSSMEYKVGFGPDTTTVSEFESKFAEYCGAKFAISTNSAGTALDMALRYLNLTGEDEVICPAINYKASQLSIIDRGAKIIFVECDPDTLNMSLEDLLSKLTEKTAAICVTHMNGLACDLDAIEKVVNNHPKVKRKIPIIADAARSCGAGYHGIKVGGDAWVTVFSFHSMKLMTTLGEGGMITTNDEIAYAKLKKMKHFGGEDDWGSNYKMTKVQAAVGIVQLSRLDEMNTARRSLAHKRNILLGGRTEFKLPTEPEGFVHIYYVYSLLLEEKYDKLIRDKIIKSLAERYKIQCSVSNPPTYSRWSYIKLHSGSQRLPVSESIGDRLICLPFHPLFTDEQNEYICAAFLCTLDEILENVDMGEVYKYRN
jgi:perosamine synthetase